MGINSHKRIGVYARVSTQEQSTELQRREVLAFLASRGWEKITIYEDKSTGTNTNRPKLRELLKDAKERKLDIIVCWKLDRLFRSLKDLISTLQEFTELGIDFISLKDNIDLTTSTGRLLMHLLGAFAEFEANLIKERVRAGLLNAKAKGKRLGRPKRRNDDQIYALYRQGLSLRRIAKELGLGRATVQAALRGRKTPQKMDEFLCVQTALL